MLTMKLVSFNKIPSEAKEDVSLLAGVIDGQPTYIAAEYLNPRTDSTGNGLVRDISEGGMKFTTVLRDDIVSSDNYFFPLTTIKRST